MSVLSEALHTQHLVEVTLDEKALLATFPDHVVNRNMDALSY